MVGQSVDDVDLLVGRDDELRVLARALTGAQHGAGSVALITGEPGIGKSALCAALARRATLVGADIRWGRCSEVEGAPVFWPWRQVLGRWPEHHAETDRFAFLDMLSMQILDLAGDGGLLVLLEDLHWADEDTLMLLGHLGRSVAAHPVLVVGTYRPEETDTDGALERTVGGPLIGATSLPLRGLSDAEVGTLLEATAPSSDLDVEAVTARSDGNPFFITQLARSWTAGSAASVPHGVRALVRTRLTTLPVEQVDVLSVAATLGRTFPVDLVRSVAGAHSEAALTAAVQRNLVVRADRPGRLRFVHALVREVLEERLDDRSAASIHARVLAHLEGVATSGDPTVLASLARHALGAASELDGQRVGAHVLAGAAAALDSGGAREAIRLSRQGLAAAPPPDQRVALLVLLGRALFNVNELQDSERTLLEAAAAAQALGDHVGAARSLLEIGSGRLVLRFDPAVRDRLAEAHDRLPVEEEALRAMVRSRCADFTGDPDEVERACRAAFGTARRTGDVEAIVRTGVRLLLNGCSWMTQAERRETVDVLEWAAGSAVAPDLAFDVAAMRCRSLLEDGNLDESVREARAADATFPGMPVTLHLGDPTEVAVATARGALEQAEELSARLAAEVARRDAADVLGPTAAGRAAALARERDGGRSISEVLRSLRTGSGAAPGGVAASQGIDIVCALALAESGDAAEARQVISEVLGTDLELMARGWGGNDLGMICLLTQAAHEARFGEAADRLLSIVAHVSDRNVVFGMPPIFMLGHGAHFAGLCHHLAGRLDEAEADLELARRSNHAMRAQGPLARTLLALADVAIDRGDGEAAHSHLRRAVRAVEGTSLDDLRHRIDARLSSLGAGVEMEGATTTTTFVFTDIVDSTARTRASGDRAWRDVLEGHTSLLRALALRHGGRVVKGLGDGYMLTFSAAHQALDFARELQSDPRTVALGVRIGVHTGEAERIDDDHVGHHVNFAARVAGAAQPGEVLVSETVHAITSTRGDLRFGAARVFLLKGIGDTALRPLLLGP